jgi:DNA-binding transcriptional LysR family regulator
LEINTVDLRQLELFVAVAEESQFTRAAVRCHIAQSALSTSIRTLERDLGTQLFARTTRNVQLTASGRVLLQEARRTLAAAAQARAAVAEVAGGLRGHVSIGTIPTPGVLDQAQLVTDYTAEHPGIELRLVRDTSMALLDQLAAGTLDMAVVSLPASLPLGMEALELLSEPISFVCREDHRLAGRKRVSLKAIAGEIFVGAPRGSVANDVLDRLFSATGADRHVPYEVNDVLVMMDFVERGLAVALAQPSLVRNRPTLRSIALQDSSLRWSLAIVTPAVPSPSVATTAFIELLRSSTEALV